PLLPLLDGDRARTLRRPCTRARRASRGLLGLRSAGAARVGRDERSDVRRDQRLLEDEVQPRVRRRALDSDRSCGRHCRRDGVGVAASTFMRTWHDFELLTLVQLPMFLFSATFFPLSTYPHALQWVVRFSPLYHATQLLRGLNFGTVGWAQAADVAYLLALGL